MTSEGHAKVDVISDITIRKTADDDHDTNEAVYYWMPSDEGYETVSIRDPFFKDCASVQIYYRFREDISPVYEVDEKEGILTIKVSTKDLERVGDIEIQSILVIHSINESTMNNKAEDVPEQGNTEGVDAAALVNESGDTIMFTEDKEVNE
jgi:hypothetical protein